MGARINDELTEKIIGFAIEVHRCPGPGLLESVYEECLCLELNQAKLSFRRQVALPVTYKGLRLHCGYRLDLVVAERIIIEVKAIENLLPVHKAQLLTYMKLGNFPVGLLLNFHCSALKDGIRRLQLAAPSHCLTGSG